MGWSPPSGETTTSPCIVPQVSCSSYAIPWRLRAGSTACQRKRWHSSSGTTPRRMTKPSLSKATRSSGRRALHGDWGTGRGSSMSDGHHGRAARRSSSCERRMEGCPLRMAAGLLPPYRSPIRRPYVSFRPLAFTIADPIADRKESASAFFAS